MLVLLAMTVPARPVAADLKVSTTGLSFIAVVGRSPEPQQFTAYAEPAVSNFAPSLQASAQTGSWLAVTSDTGGSFRSGVTVVVSVNSASLPLGNYSGTVTVTQSGLTGSPASVPVSLRVVPAAPYIAADPEAITVVARPGVDPAPATLTARNAGTGSMNSSFTATASGGGTWLALSQPIASSFQNSVSVSVQIRSASLPAGTYTGVVTVTAPGASNSPLNVPVNLTVGATSGPVISASPSSLSFLAGLGANPTQKMLNINNTGSGTLRPTVAGSTADGGRWLLVSSVIGGSFGSSASVEVRADITGLNKGSYTGGITITDAAATNSPVRVPVMLVVDDPRPVMSLSSYSLGFWTPVGSYQASRFLDVYNIGTGLMRWRAAATTQGPTNWLVFLPESDEAVTTFARAFVDSTGLPAGIYRGEITITAAYVASGANPQRVAVTLGVGVPLATVNNAGIVNAASFNAASAAAGSIVSIFGRDLGPRQGVRAGLVGGKLPTDLAAVRVLLNHVPVPLFYVSELQLNVQVPLELAGNPSATVEVEVNNLLGPAVVLNLRPADPGVFQVSGRPAIFLNDSNTQISAEVPARAGDFLVIYATGLGAVDTALETGAPAPVTGLVRTRTTPRVTLGGVPVPVLFSGLSPGFVGLYQINVQVPAGVPSGNNVLIVAMGSAETAPMIVPVR